MHHPGGGGGGVGGHSAHILLGKVKTGGSGAAGAGSSVKLGSPELTCRTHLACTLAGCILGALAERFAFGLTTVSKPAVGGDGTA